MATYNLYLGADLAPVLGPRGPEELARNLAEVQRQLGVTTFAARAPALARVLAHERPDLVGLQEVCTWSSDGAVVSDQRAELLGALHAAGEPYEVVSSCATFRGSGRLEAAGRGLALEGSNVILRRRDCEIRVERSRSGLFGDALTVAVQNGEVAIARGWCEVECRLGGRGATPFRFVDTHTEAYEPGSRDRQRDELLAVLGEGDAPVVVVGDFNARPGDVGLPRPFVDAWTAAGHPSDAPEGWTCCQAADLSGAESRLYERIDYVWVRGARVTACRRAGAGPADRTATGLWPSDHAAVVADLVVA